MAIQAHAFSVGQLMTSWLTACATASWAPGLKTAIGAPTAWPVIGASSRYS
jgi:hypothetical protein